MVKVPLDFHKIATKHLSRRSVSHHYLLTASFLIIESDLNGFGLWITYHTVAGEQ
jgi:hypothetical protein